MFKQIVFVAILAVAFALPAPEAQPEPKPAAKPGQLLYSSPLVAAAPIAYSAAYSAPLTYAAAPLAYSAHPAVSAYSSPYVASIW
ncbi:uncharacterized protein LOC109541734 [Dendroctonus ponderosae]|uniref:Cuticle protein n=1 Tax=Dendroctonus ponderosae TaxID=77166 RepID=U4U8R0_DENPD|nr:uncharacterized protein LOC109541734 [Dendroctonus ponderosae]ERL89422.1 hypothetical protein D910_06789 [Dendroctonus ponderosae]